MSVPNSTFYDAPLSAWRRALMEMEDAQAQCWMRNATKIRREMCDPRWNNVRAAMTQLRNAKAEYLGSARAAGLTVDKLVDATNDCATCMRNGLRAMGEGVPLPLGVG